MQENKSKLINIKISKNIPQIRYFSPVSCGRLYIAEYVDIDKCLYLDSDTLCLSNLDQLFNIDLHKNIIGAVVDPRYSKISDQISNIKNIECYSCFLDRPAFNSGVLLLNLKLWREYNLTEEITNWIGENNSSLSLRDQSALIFFMKGDFIALDKKWNICLYKTKIDKRQPISILHFNGQEKPWASKDVKFQKLWASFYHKDKNVFFKAK